VRFIDKLKARWSSSQSMLCVGLYPDPAKLPEHLRPAAGSSPDDVCEAISRFCIELMDACAEFSCAFKPQIAYFHAAGAEAALERVMAHARDKHPEVVLILDAKRGDIGATAEQYAKEAFIRYQADAVTLSPFMGYDSMEPYLRYKDKGAIVLCRTSNPGGDDFQSLMLSHDEALYQRIARLAAEQWNGHQQLSLVVGATYPAELAKVRALAPDLPLLVPGIGAQGGDVVATVQAGQDASGFGMMINSSRAIIYASAGRDFAQAAGLVARQTRDAILDAARTTGTSGP
jgi:orotidine-5'-phosphate decarboxylase